MGKKSIRTTQDSNTRFSRSVSNYQNILTFQTSLGCVCSVHVQHSSVERSVTFVNNCQYFDVSDWFSHSLSFSTLVSLFHSSCFGLCYHGAGNCTMCRCCLPFCERECVYVSACWFSFHFYFILLLCGRTTTGTQYDPP